MEIQFYCLRKEKDADSVEYVNISTLEFSGVP